MSASEPSAIAKDRLARRPFLCGLWAAAAMPVLASGVLSACQSSPPAVPEGKRTATLDQAHDLLFASGRGYRGSTHVPMVAEALMVLGRVDSVLPWVERNKGDGERNQQPYDFTQAGEVTKENWRAALGQEERRADWAAFFARQLRERGWQATVGEWVATLTPGIAAYASHGIIRTAHAVRSLEVAESSQRQRELAEGLGLWAATYQPLPARSSTAAGKLNPAEAMRRVETMTPERVRRGNIIMALSSLEDFPPFADAINWVDTSGNAGQFLANLTETAAGVYLANARDSRSPIALVHALTGTSAARLLLSYIKAEAQPVLLRYGWQLAAGIYAVAGRRPPEGVPQAKLPDKDDLIDRALKNGGAHPIKFTEACLREYALNPNPVYLYAAQHAVENLRG